MPFATSCSDLAVPPGTDAYDPMLRAAEAHLARYEHDPLVHHSLAVSIPEVASDRMLTRVSALVR